MNPLRQIEQQAYYEDRSQNPIVTEDLIESLRTGQGGWCKLAFAYLGIAHPLSKGWKATILNKPRQALPFPGLGSNLGKERRREKRAGALSRCDLFA